MTEPTTPLDETGEQTTIDAMTGKRQPRLAVRLLGLALVIFSVVVATYLVVAYFAFESGQAQRVEQEATTRAEQISRQIELARQDLAEGSDNLALTRLDWVLAQDATNADAQALRQEVLNSRQQPTPASTEPPIEPEPAAEESTDGDATADLQAIRRLTAAERWDEALPLLLAFQHAYPDHERGQTDQLLYDAYVALGLQAINTDRIEMGLNYFSQAERLGNLPQEALDYRVWADLYYQAVAYSGVNWDIAAGYWRDLCNAAPFFQGACERFQIALIGLGDQLAYQLDWCPAVPVYQEAWNRQPTESLDAKLAQAREGCASATPVPITGTNPTGSEE